ncbi:MAG: hypothetical protein HYZ27_01945 [Deltaproteobacteria bacterium]|nr:hypothetical protein [Deltaproteobacteria bacterium]
MVLLALVAAGQAFAAEPAPKFPVGSVAVLPIKAKGNAKKSLPDVLDDLLLSSLQTVAGPELRVVGKSDIDAMLGFEKTKDTVGCNEVACAAEIAGALGVDSIISATAGTLGGKYVLTLVWIDQKQAKAFKRHSETLGKSEEDFDNGVRMAVSALLGVTAPQAASTRTTASHQGAKGGAGIWDETAWDEGVWAP